MTGKSTAVTATALGTHRECQPGDQQRNYGEALHANILRLSPPVRLRMSIRSFPHQIRNSGYKLHKIWQPIPSVKI
jgi:hypothetical protein